MGLFNNNAAYDKTINDAYMNAMNTDNDLYEGASALTTVLTEARNRISAIELKHSDLINQIWSQIEGQLIDDGIISEANIDKIVEMVVALDESLSILV
jgi:hypothetical protein